MKQDTKKIILMIIFTLLLSKTTFSYCGESKKFYALAVVGNESELAKIIVESARGSGIMLDLNILYGIETQQSIKTAYELANDLAKKECKFYISLPDLNNEIDGPSAGALFALKFYEIETGLKPRLNYIITGGIGADGSIFPVGGVYEKMQSYLKSDYKIMFYNTGKPETDLIIASYSLKNKKPAYPVDKIEEVINILYNKTEPYVNISKYLDKKVNKKTSYNSSLIKESADKYIKEERYLLQNFQFPYYYEEYLKLSLKLQEDMRNKGYYYTAANEGFNRLSFMRAYLDLEYSNEEEKVEELKKCLDSIKFYDEREDNMEYIAGAKARYYRAKEIYEEYNKTSRDGLLDSKLNELDNLEKAILWCDSASRWNVEGEGLYINKKELLDKINRLNLSKDELSGRFKEMLEEGDYLAFLYEYSFIKKGSFKLKKKYWSKWANVYASQAEYLKEENKSWRDLASISNNLEELFSNMSYVYKGEGINKNKTYLKNKEISEFNRNKGKDIYYFAILIGFISFIGGVLTCILLKRLKE